jgi:hypothetical protein
MFPGGALSYFSDDTNAYLSSDVFQLNGFSRGVQPQYGTVHLRGHDYWHQPSDDPEAIRREYFYVEADGVWFVFRICTAYPDKGYDEWIAGIAYREVGTFDKFDLHARDYVTSRSRRVYDGQGQDMTPEYRLAVI